MQEPNESDRILVKGIVSAIGKVSFYVCLTIVAGMMISTCKVDKEVIIQCEDSCGTTRGIKEVTGTSCECNDAPQILESPWVLPKAQ
jgi:hypothetical protein